MATLGEGAWKGADVLLNLEFNKGQYVFISSDVYFKFKESGLFVETYEGLVRGGWLYMERKDLVDNLLMPLDGSWDMEKELGEYYESKD